jgi:hypothetical protein
MRCAVRWSAPKVSAISASETPWCRAAALVFDLDAPGAVIVEEAVDVCGVAARGAGFAATTGAGRFRCDGAEVTFPDLAFDNHLVRIR